MDNNNSMVWSKVGVVGRGRSAFVHSFGRFYGLCVDAYHPVPVVRYSTSIHGGSSLSVIHARSLSSSWVVINNFNTKRLSRENPFIPYNNSFYKRTNLTPSVGIETPQGWYCDDDCQFRLVQDVVRYNRYNEMVKWHGRENIEDKAGRIKKGVVEFANYSPAALDLIELAALGDGRRVERNRSVLHAYPARFSMRVDRLYRFHDRGVSLNGRHDFLLTRFQGKVGFVGIRDNI